MSVRQTRYLTNARFMRRVQRRALVPRLGRARSLRKLRHGVPHAFPGSHWRQLERNHEGRSPRGLRQRGGLREKLLRRRRHSANVFRHFRADGAVRVGQRSGRRAHETSRGVPQTGKDARGQ